VAISVKGNTATLVIDGVQNEIVTFPRSADSKLNTDGTIVISSPTTSGSTEEPFIVSYTITSKLFLTFLLN